MTGSHVMSLALIQVGLRQRVFFLQSIVGIEGEGRA